MNGKRSTAGLTNTVEYDNDDHENHEDKEKEVASTIDMIIE